MDVYKKKHKELLLAINDRDLIFCQRIITKS